jgi:hypothetical protein
VTFKISAKGPIAARQEAVWGIAPALPTHPLHACYVRFTPESGHCWAKLGCPLCAKSGLMQCRKEPASRTEFWVRSPAQACGGAPVRPARRQFLDAIGAPVLGDLALCSRTLARCSRLLHETCHFFNWDRWLTAGLPFREHPTRRIHLEILVALAVP